MVEYLVCIRCGKKKEFSAYLKGQLKAKKLLDIEYLCGVCNERFNSIKKKEKEND